MMKAHRTQAGILGLFLLMLMGGLCLVTCDEAPLEPKDDDPTVKDYQAWFWDGLDRYTLFSYHTATGEVDSATIPWRLSSNPTVSADGSLIYIPSGDVVKVLETDSLTTVGEIQHFPKRPVVVSPDGQYVAVLGDSTWIVKTSDYSTLYTDTALAFNGYFSSDSKTFYTAHFNIRKISLADQNQIVSELVYEGLGIRQVIPTPDESKFLVYFPVATFAWAFGVYDQSLESLVSSDILQPGNGVFAMTPDGRMAFYGNPGDITFLGNSELTVFDVENDRVIKRWNMDGLIDEFERDGSPIGEMVISPDGRWLLAHRGPINMSESVIQWDIEKERIAAYYHNPARGASGLTIQLNK